MRRTAIIFLVGIGLAVPITAGASALKHSTHATLAGHRSIVRFERHGGRLANDQNELRFPGTVTAVTAPTATAAGSLTVTVGTQAIVLPLAMGSTLPPSIVVGAMVELKIEVQQVEVAPNPGNVGDDDDNDDNANQGLGLGNGGQIVVTPAAGTTTGTFGGNSNSGRGSSGSGDGDGGGHSGHGGGGDD